MSAIVKPPTRDQLRVQVQYLEREIGRQQADIDKLLDERQGWLDEIRGHLTAWDIERADNERLRTLGRETLSALETLGEDGWSEAPYLLKSWRGALEEKI